MVKNIVIFKETQCGFEWGAMKITRLYSDVKWGVFAEIETPRERMEIRVTPSGLIRLGKVMRRKK